MMLTNREKQLVSSRYVNPNKFITPGLYDDLVSALCCIRLSTVVEMANVLGVLGSGMHNDQYDEYTITDIMCIEGDNEYAAASGRYYFYAGPELNIPNEQLGQRHCFKLIKGNMLDWIVDCILLKITYDGYKVLHDLGIPL